jgi:hypothetical protein
MVLLRWAMPTLAAATLDRVTVLPSGDRASLVVEMTEQVPSVSRTAPDRTTVIVDAGPMSEPIRPQELIPDVAVPCIAGVSITGHSDSSAGAFLRLRIRLLSACRSAVRSNGRRIYVDLAAMDSVTPLESVSTGPSVARTRTPAATREAAKVEEATKPVQDIQSRGEIDLQTLRSDILARARALAAQPDVMGLIRLRDEAARKYQRLASEQPDVRSRLLDDLDALTNDARALRLKLDGIEFKREAERLLNPRFPSE